MSLASGLDRRVTFQSPIQSRDDDGRIVQGWKDRFTVAGGIRYLRGGEEVMQARMQARTPAILTVRAASDARQVTAEWRAVIDGRVFELKEEPRPTVDRRLLEMLAEA